MHPVFFIALCFLGLYILLQIGGAIDAWRKGSGDGKTEVLDLGYAPPEKEKPQSQPRNMSDQVEQAAEKRKHRKFYPAPRRHLPSGQRLALPPPPCHWCGKRVLPQSDGTCGNCGAAPE